MSRSSNKRRRRKVNKANRAGMHVVTFVVFLLLIVMSLNIARLWNKNEQYKDQEKVLAQELSDEQDRQEEITEYEQYVTTDDFVEEIAKSKLGLVYNDEIIFKVKE